MTQAIKLARPVAIATFATLACLAFGTQALAKCGTGQLNGNWTLSSDLSTTVDVTISNGTLTIPGDGDYPITQGKKCKVTLVAGGTSFIGSSEALSTGTSVKPRKIYIGSTSPMTWLVLHRR
jgi:hypothetical protein